MNSRNMSAGGDDRWQQRGPLPPGGRGAPMPPPRGGMMPALHKTENRYQVRGALLLTPAAAASQAWQHAALATPSCPALPCTACAAHYSGPSC